MHIEKNVSARLAGWRNLALAAATWLGLAALGGPAAAQTAYAGGAAVYLGGYFGTAPESPEPGYTDGPHLQGSLSKGSYNYNTSSYTAYAASSGTETLSFAYRCNMGTASPSFCGGFSVTVTIVKPPATAGSYTGATAYNTPLTFAPSVTNSSGIEVLSQPAHGSATASGNNLTYSPSSGWYGSDSFTFRACGSGGCSAATTATVSTNPEPLVVNDYTGSTPYQTALTFSPTIVSGVVTSVVNTAGPGHGTLVINGTSMTYTPAPGYVGGDGISLIYYGPAGQRGVNVNLSTQAPVIPTITGGSLALAFNTAGSHNFSPSVPSTLAVTVSAQHGATVINGGQVQYTPSSDYIGSDSFTVTATGPGGTSQPATVNVTVAPPPTPSITGGSLHLPFNTGGEHNFAPTSGGTLAIATAPAHGTATINGGRVSYEPNENYIGDDSFSVTATNLGGTSAPATVSVTVDPPPIPMVTGGSLRLAFNASGQHDFAPTSAGVVAITSGPAHGTATLSGGRVSYQPNEDFIGSDSITVEATNLGGTSAPAILNITIDPPPIPVILGGSLRLSFNQSGSHDFAPTERGTLTISTAPAHGTASINGGLVTYEPNEDYIGADTFAVTATNLGGTSAPATVNVTVDPPPIPTITGGSLRLAFNASGTHDFAPTDRGALAISTPPTHGTATINGGRVSYEPNDDYIGSDAFAVTATNLGGTSAPASVAVTVDPPPIPVISAASVSTAFNRAVSYEFTPTDRGQVAITAQPAHGAATLSGNTITFTPAQDYIGSDTLSVTATNLGGTSAPVSLTITVAAPDAPAAANAAIATSYETVGSVELVVSGLYRDLKIVTQPSHGSVALVGLLATYTPEAGYFGPDTFTYEATGFGGSSGPATVNITVGRPNAPVAAAKTLALGHGGAGDVTLEATGVFSRFRVVTAPSNGAVTLNGSTAHYVPKSGFGGADVFEYVAEGPGGDSVPAKVSITVEDAPPPPAAPVITPPTEVPVSSKGEPVAFALRASEPTATFSVSRQPKLGRASIQGQTATYTPNEGAKGEDSFAVVAKGAGGVQSAPVEFKVALQAAPEPEQPVGKPVAAELSAEVEQGAEVRIAATGGATGGPFDAVTVVEQPSSGELRVEGLELVFKASAEFTGDLVAKYAVNANGQVSDAAILKIVVRAVPKLAAKQATAAGGQAALVSLTAGAEGGPFVGGTIMTVSPATAGRAEILSGEAAQAALNALAAQSGKAAAPVGVEEGDVYLRFQPDPKFNGSAVIRYALTNAGGAKAQGELRVEVRNLPDPTRDPSVAALVAAETQAAMRFGSAQVANVNRRLEALHDQQAGKGNLAVSASGGNMLHQVGQPGFDPIRERERASRIPQRLSDESASAVAPNPVSTGKVWASGAIQFGRAKGRDGGQGFDFTTNGLSVGADTQIGPNVVVGAGGGFGRNVSDLAKDLGKVDARSGSIFAYGSFRPVEQLFVDGVVGASKMNFKNTRTVQATGGEVRGDRSGDQMFGSVSASWNYATDAVRLSPYARLEYVRSTLAAYSEKGDETYGLTYSKLKVDEMNVSAGLRAEYTRRMSTGILMPRARAELTQILAQTGTSRVSYTSLGDGPTFGIDGTPTGMTSVLGGVGLVWRGDNGWEFNLDVERSASGSGNGVTSVRVGGSGRF